MSKVVLTGPVFFEYCIYSLDTNWSLNKIISGGQVGFTENHDLYYCNLPAGVSFGTKRISRSMSM